MAESLPGNSSEIMPSEEPDLKTILGQLLPRGHALHGYSSAMNERVIKILPSKLYSDGAPLLGYGVDSDAERALARALLTYARRELDGLDYMEADQYSDMTEGYDGMTGHQSKFDNIVWGADFTLYQEDEEVIAASNYGGGWGMDRLEVRGASALESLRRFINEYNPPASSQRTRDRLNALPGLVWLQTGEDGQLQIEG